MGMDYSAISGALVVGRWFTVFLQMAHAKWGVEDVVQWLRRADFAEHIESFRFAVKRIWGPTHICRAQDIDGSVLVDLTLSDLRQELGLSLGKAKKVLFSIKDSKHTNVSYSKRSKICRKLLLRHPRLPQYPQISWKKRRMNRSP